MRTVNLRIRWEDLNGEVQTTIVDIDDLIIGKGTFADYHKIVSRDFSTGLKDKNGVEIYEGDILDFAYNGGEIKGPVEWSAKNAAFGIKNGDYYEMLNGILSIEVIGTIYENKELLK